MTQATPWLPASALCDTRTAAPVAHALGEWSAAWLAGGLVVPPRWEACDAANSMGFALADQGEGYRLLVRSGATLDLAGLLLGREIDERACRTRHDRAVIEHLVKVALAALAERLGDVLKRTDGDTPAWFALPIATADGMPLLRLEAARPVVVALATEWAGTPRRGDPLPPRRTALETQPLRLAARVGASRLALSQIEALEVGDVLTLDTPLSMPLAACIDGKRAGEAALALAPGSEQLELRIERPASQW